MKDILKGKALEGFEKWYKVYIKRDSDKLISNTDLNYFWLLTESMQYGVLEDWFDSVGVIIDVLSYGSDEFTYYVDGYPLKVTKTRIEGRMEAIKKGVEIYNKL